MDKDSYLQAEALKLASKCRNKQSVAGDLEFELRKVNGDESLADELRNLYALFTMPEDGAERGLAHRAGQRLTDLLVKSRKNSNVSEGVRVAREYLEVVEPGLPRYICAYFDAMTDAFSRPRRTEDTEQGETEEDTQGLRYFTVQDMVEFLKGEEHRTYSFKKAAAKVRHYFKTYAPETLRSFGPERLRAGRQGNNLPIRNRQDKFWVAFFREMGASDPKAECGSFYDTHAKELESID